MSEMPSITPESLIAILDDLKTTYSAVIDQLDVSASAPGVGEWNARQVLSHIIGSLHRVPIHVGYYLADASAVPVVYSDPYWIEAWSDAPVAAFKAAFEASVEGNKSLVRSLSPDVFWRSLSMAGFGGTPLAVFLLVNYKDHIKDQHLHQLQAFVGAAQPA